MTEINTNTDTWLQVERWAKARIEHHRDALEMQGLDERRADFARGSVAVLRELIAVGEPSPMPIDTAGGAYNEDR